MRVDTVVRGGLVVLPGREPAPLDIGVVEGRIAVIASDLEVDADDVVDATGRTVFPGAVDAHYHLGIYRGLAEDARSETLSSLAGGVTSVISYFRSGSHYLNRSGPYEELFPEVLETVAGNSYTDYAFHLAPMSHDQTLEIPRLVDAHGVRSFKYYMFYKGMDLAGSGKGEDERMSGVYDLGHMFEIMEQVAEVNAQRPPEERISLSIHAEQSELIRVFMQRVKERGELQGLEAYSAGRPPLTERLAIAEAGVLAAATAAPVNLLHLSSEDALAAAVEFERENPQLDVRLETTLHHLALSYQTYNDQRGKVNPPIRAESDREALWDGVVRGDLDWIVSDHACCSESHKEGDMWAALPGFGGSALLYPYLLTEGTRRGLKPWRVAELVAGNPARSFGLAGLKGEIVVGADADLAIIDMETAKTVTPEVLLSAQEYTPFEGMELTGWPTTTMVRGRVALQDGQSQGEPSGGYIREALGQVAQAAR